MIILTTFNSTLSIDFFSLLRLQWPASHVNYNILRLTQMQIILMTQIPNEYKHG